MAPPPGTSAAHQRPLSSASYPIAAPPTANLGLPPPGPVTKTGEGLGAKSVWPPPPPGALHSPGLRHLVLTPSREMLLKLGCRKGFWEGGLECQVCPLGLHQGAGSPQLPSEPSLRASIKGLLSGWSSPLEPHVEKFSNRLQFYFRLKVSQDGI